MPEGRARTSSGDVLIWVSGAWTLPILAMVLLVSPEGGPIRGVAIPVALLLAPVPALLIARRRHRRLQVQVATAEEQAVQLKLQLETVRYRTTRLREELQAADRQARLSHQLTLLGQFTAGFMHEFNNPLAIVAGRLEVLLEERKDDAALCVDLEQMLKEARYMSRIAATLLQALRRERRADVFEASDIQKMLADVIQTTTSETERQGILLEFETGDAPRVDVPEHVVSEVVRGLLNNAIHALKNKERGVIRVRLEPYRTAGARVVVRIEDNGEGVPESIREHLFEPFVSQSVGRDHLGLGLFLAASLLDMYDGRIRYEPTEAGGARFVLELPPARFTRGQPYHWIAGEAAE